MPNPPLKIQGKSANWAENKGSGTGPPPKKLAIQGSSANYGGLKISKRSPSSASAAITKNSPINKS